MARIEKTFVAIVALAILAFVFVPEKVHAQGTGWSDWGPLLDVPGISWRSRWNTGWKDWDVQLHNDSGALVNFDYVFNSHPPTSMRDGVKGTLALSPSRGQTLSFNTPGGDNGLVLYVRAQLSRF